MRSVRGDAQELLLSAGPQTLLQAGLCGVSAHLSDLFSVCFGSDAARTAKLRREFGGSKRGSANAFKGVTVRGRGVLKCRKYAHVEDAHKLLISL